jgi:myosin heavy subunit
MTTLVEMTSETLLDNIQRRYVQDLIYTYTGMYGRRL